MLCHDCSLHKLMCCQSLFIIKWTRKEDIWQLKCLLLMNVYFPKLLKFRPSHAGVPSLALMPDFTLMSLQLAVSLNYVFLLSKVMHF